jgi:hypothetical protein
MLRYSLRGMVSLYDIFTLIFSLRGLVSLYVNLTLIYLNVESCLHKDLGLSWLYSCLNFYYLSFVNAYPGETCKT